MELDFSRIATEGVRVLIGHDKGVAVRLALGLPDLDQADEQVFISIPVGLKTITPSFVQGLFAESVHKLGEKRFFEHYRFRATPNIIADIRAGVDRALTSRHLSGA